MPPTNSSSASRQRLPMRTLSPNSPWDSNVPSAVVFDADVDPIAFVWREVQARA